MNFKRLLLVFILLLSSTFCFAENRTLSWDPVTTYEDTTPIESVNRPVTYTMYWSYDNTLPVSSLHTIVSNTTGTSAVFDPTIQGMNKFPIFFTGKAIIKNGLESILAPPFKWDPTEAPTNVIIF